MASLSTINEQSECSNVVCVVRIELYGSTTAVLIRGAVKNYRLLFYGEQSDQ